MSGVSEETMASQPTQPGSTLDEIMHPRARKLFALWSAWGSEGDLPLRSQMDLAGLKPVLPYMVILERHPVRQSFTFRLAGTALRRFCGMEPTGADFLSLWGKEDGAALGRMLDRVVGKGVPAILRVRGVTAGDRQVAFEVPCLPVRVDGRRSVQVLGAFLPFSEPFWLGEQPLIRYRLMGMQLIRPGAFATPARTPTTVPGAN